MLPFMAFATRATIVAVAVIAAGVFLGTMSLLQDLVRETETARKAARATKTKVARAPMRKAA